MPKGRGKKNDYQKWKDRLQAVTMIDPATGSIEIRREASARADLASNIVKLEWLTRYSLPSKVIVDRGN